MSSSPVSQQDAGPHRGFTKERTRPCLSSLQAWCIRSRRSVHPGAEVGSWWLGSLDLGSNILGLLLTPPQVSVDRLGVIQVVADDGIHIRQIQSVIRLDNALRTGAFSERMNHKVEQHPGVAHPDRTVIILEQRNRHWLECHGCHEKILLSTTSRPRSSNLYHYSLILLLPVDRGFQKAPELLDDRLHFRPLHLEGKEITL